MSLIDTGLDVTIGNSTITLNKTADLLSALVRCVNRYREINKNHDEFTCELLSDLDRFLAAKSVQLSALSLTQGEVDESQNEDASNEFSSRSSDHELQEENLNRLVDELHCNLNEQIEQDRLGEKTRSVTEQHSHEPSEGGAEQSEQANHLCNVSQTSLRPEVDAPGLDARESTNNKGPELSFDIEDDVVRLQPDQNQWSDFKRILQQAKPHVAAGNGFRKIIVPGAGILKESTDSALPCFSYAVRTRENGTVAVETKPDGTTFLPSQEEDTSSLSVSATVNMFERRIKQESGLRGVQYRTDIKARTESERNPLGLPASPIWPLAGDNLNQTRVRIPGIHWPYAYEANYSFGAIFAMHQEDWDLYSINYLYKGSKVWIVIPPYAADFLEQKFRENSKERLSNCAQFIRHNASYVPLEVLDRWKVPYKITRQNAGEAMLTFPRAYHQGFSTGGTLAEAVNYADQDWSPGSYAVCSPRTCPKELISRDMMEIREADEEQLSTNEGEPDNPEAAHAGQTNKGKIETIKRQNTRRGLRIKSTKRQRTEKEPYEPPKKSHKSSHNSASGDTGKIKVQRRLKASEILEGVTSRPAIDVGTIYQGLMTLQSDSNIASDDSRVLTLMRLFYAIASPDAVCQLRDACQLIRKGAFQITESTEDLSSTIKALDRLDTNDHIVSLTKRFYLVALSEKRFEFQARFSKGSGRLRTTTVQETSDEVLGRDDVLALAEMMKEAYSHLKPTRPGKTGGRDEYGIKRKILKDRLASGQKWSKLSKAFDSGILALVPTQGEYHVSNRE